MLMLIEILRLVQEYCFIFRKRQWNPVCKFSRKIPDLSNQATTNWHNPNDVEDTRKTLTQLFSLRGNKMLQASANLPNFVWQTTRRDIWPSRHFLTQSQRWRGYTENIDAALFMFLLPSPSLCESVQKKLPKHWQNWPNLITANIQNKRRNFLDVVTGRARVHSNRNFPSICKSCKTSRRELDQLRDKKLFLQINKHSNEQQMNTRIQMIRWEIK